MNKLNLALERLDRMNREPLRLFRPATTAQYLAAKCEALELLITGGNRSGKTYLAMMLFASRVLGVPIHAMWGNGIMTRIKNISDAANKDENYEPLRKYLASTERELNPIKNSFPIPTPDFPRLYWILGRDQDHIGQRMYKFLFLPGHVKLIRDHVTERLRIYNPADPRDKVRETEVVPAEPIIPPRFIVSDSWKFIKGKKREDVFSEVTLINGAVIRAYGTKGAPVMGDEIDGAYIDEDTSQDWLAETQRRLLNRDGWLIWAVWPQMKNFAVIDLQQRVKNGDPHIKEFVLTFSDNPFASKKQKERSDAMAGSEDEIRRRDYGETLADKLTMYQIDDNANGIGEPAVMFEPKESMSNEGRQRLLAGLQRKIEFRGWKVSKQKLLSTIWDEGREFPPEWTRYLAIDPSNTRTAVLFGVVPPPVLCGMKIGRTVIIESELIREQCNADNLAKAIKEYVGNKRYEAFIMDKREGRKNATGRDNTTFDHYAQAFAKHQLFSRLTKNSFEPGIDVPSFRQRTVREFIDGTSGQTDFFYVRYTTPHLQHEFQKYRKKRTMADDGTVQVLDEPANPKKYDVMSALEYLLAYLHAPFTMGIAYQKPETYVVETIEDGLPEIAARIAKSSVTRKPKELELLTPFLTQY